MRLIFIFDTSKLLFDGWVVDKGNRVITSQKERKKRKKRKRGGVGQELLEKVVYWEDWTGVERVRRRVTVLLRQTPTTGDPLPATVVLAHSHSAGVLAAWSLQPPGSSSRELLPPPTTIYFLEYTISDEHSNSILLGESINLFLNNSTF